MQGWQKLVRNTGRLLLFPGGVSWCIKQHSCLHPIECHRNSTNEERPLQHFWDFHGKLSTIGQILWHGTSEQGTNCAQKLRTEFVTEIQPCNTPRRRKVPATSMNAVHAPAPGSWRTRPKCRFAPVQTHKCVPTRELRTLLDVPLYSRVNALVPVHGQRGSLDLSVENVGDTGTCVITES